MTTLVGLLLGEVDLEGEEEVFFGAGVLLGFSSTSSSSSSSTDSISSSTSSSASLSSLCVSKIDAKQKKVFLKLNHLSLFLIVFVLCSLEAPLSSFSVGGGVFFGDPPPPPPFCCCWGNFFLSAGDDSGEAAGVSSLAWMRPNRPWLWTEKRRLTFLLPHIVF